jgi:hypothetical protein
VPLVLDLRIAHDRVGSSADPSLNGHSKHPNNLDQLLNDAANDKIRKYRADYNDRTPSAVSFMPAIASTSRQTGYIVNLSDFYIYRLIRETDRFFADSGVQLAQTQCVMFHFRRAAFSAQLKAKVGSTLQTSRLLTSTLSLGVPVPRVTQCM